MRAVILASFVLVALSSLAAAEELYGSPEGTNARAKSADSGTGAGARLQVFFLRN